MRQQLLDGQKSKGKNTALMNYGIYNSYNVPFTIPLEFDAANPMRKERNSPSIFSRERKYYSLYGTMHISHYKHRLHRQSNDVYDID